MSPFRAVYQDGCHMIGIKSCGTYIPLLRLAQSELGRTFERGAGTGEVVNEISRIELHDCFSISELLVYEGLGVSEKAKSSADVDAGTFHLDGNLPINPDGGLNPFGHPVGASGVRKVYELYKLGLAQSQGEQPGAFECIITIVGLPA